MRYEQFAKKTLQQYLQRGLADGESIPDMELYIDQMVNCLNSELALYAKDGEGPITKGMVSNYTKHRMILGPNGKRYSKTHCIFILLVFYLKEALSMDQVERMMRPVLSNYHSDWDEDMDIPSLFRGVIHFAELEGQDLCELLNVRMDSIKRFLAERGSDDDISEITMLITLLIMRSNAERFLAEKLLDEYFPGK